MRRVVPTPSAVMKWERTNVFVPRDILEILDKAVHPFAFAAGTTQTARQTKTAFVDSVSVFLRT